MDAQFKRGILELCVMSMLAERDHYGYEIIRELSLVVDVSENTIYPILRRLTKEGRFTTYLKSSSSGAPRKYYTMTQKGFEHYVKQRETWDEFIGGVYHIIDRGGKKIEQIFKRFARRTEKDIINDN